MSYNRFFKDNSGSSDAESESVSKSGELELSADAADTKKTTLYDIYLIDFDGTISADHTHNGIYKQLVAGTFNKQDDDAIFSYIQNNPQYHPIGGSQDWKMIIEEIVKNNCHVAIVSFNSFPKMIASYLRHIIGLSPETVSKIYINSWLPEKPESASKLEHIAQVIQYFQYQGDTKKILLVDDSSRNIDQASRAGYDVIYANQYGGHVTQLKFDLQVAEPDDLQTGMDTVSIKYSG